MPIGYSKRLFLFFNFYGSAMPQHPQTASYTDLHRIHLPRAALRDFLLDDIAVFHNKDQNLVVCQNGTRNRQTLFLTAGDVASALGDRRFVFVIFASMNSVACAISAAFAISSSDASSFPKRRLMRSFRRTEHLSAVQNRFHPADLSL